MNTAQECNTNSHVCSHTCGKKCISWSAVFVGAIIAIGLSFLLNLFSVAIGLSIYTVNPEGIRSIAIGGTLAFAFGIIVSMFFAGWVAGYLGRSHCDKKCCGPVHGFTTWCLALILMILLAAPFSHFVTNYANYLSHTTATAVLSDPHNTSKQKSATTAASVETAEDLSKGAFVLFLLFFIGALASTAGGHVGVLACASGCCNCKIKNKL